MKQESKLLAFHGKPEVKEKYVERVKKHRIADEIVQGVYWENGKGCAVGCTIRGSDHSKYETELGIPVELAYLEDAIFEGLSNGEAKDFPLEFLQSITPGSDLSNVALEFKIWLQKRNLRLQEEQSKKFPELKEVYERVIAAIQGVIHVHEVELRMGEKDEAALSAARSAAWSAAWSARSAARSAAWSAAWSARSAARSASESAAWSARSAAQSARSAQSAAESAYQDMKKELIKLIKKTEVE